MEVEVEIFFQIRFLIRSRYAGDGGAGIGDKSERAATFLRPFQTTCGAGRTHMTHGVRITTWNIPPMLISSRPPG